MKKHTVIRALVSFSLFVSLIPLTSSVHAQVSSGGTTIVPPTFELFANPGDSLSEKISIRNETGSEEVYNISAADFEASGDNGEVQLVKGDSSRSFSLASWINADQTSVDIPAHREGTISFIINVPNNAEPGGHYGAIQIQSGAGNTPGAANVSAGQVSLVLLRVSGNVTEKASIVGFSAPGYSEYGPVPLTLKVQNAGNAHIKPSGTIIITDMFGAKVDEIQLNGSNVLPNAARNMVTYWTNKNPIGRFTATLVATYGEKHEALLASTTFTVIPKPLVIGVSIAIVSLIIIILLVISGRKRIAKALKVIAQG